MKKIFALSLLVIGILTACAKPNSNNKELSTKIESLESEIAYLKTDKEEVIAENNASLLNIYQRSMAAQHHIFQYAYDKNALKNDFLMFFGFDQISDDKNLLAMLPYLHPTPEKPEHVSAYDFYLSLPNLLNHIDRSDNNVKLLFESNKKLIFSWIDAYMYYKSQAFLFTDALLATHKQMTNSPNYLQWMNDIVKHPVSSVDNREELVLLFEKQFGTLNHLELVKRCESEYEAEIKRQMRMKYWLFSFWVRRFQEGNINAVHGILMEISQYYAQK
ncbi:MAG: hypothetical protein KDI39_03965 [Pseudomonadales bacterium]|nr:hypothetical protein [Pseudomonadales bacterium]